MYGAHFVGFLWPGGTEGTGGAEFVMVGVAHGGSEADVEEEDEELDGTGHELLPTVTAGAPAPEEVEVPAPVYPHEEQGHEEQAELPGPAGKGGGKEGGGEPADGYTADELADFARGKEAAHAPKDERAGHNEQQGGELGAEGHRLSPGEGAQVVDDVGLTDGQVEIEKKEQEARI